LAPVAEEKGPPPEGPAITFARLMKEEFVKASDLKNPTEAETPETGVGWVSLGTDCAITYPRSSSGPFHHSNPVAVNPTVGVPTAKFPTWSVPVIPVPVLYAKGLEVAILDFLFYSNLYLDEIVLIIKNNLVYIFISNRQTSN
jgi:hypothetical protein